MASMGLNIDEQKAVERFRKEVVDPSQDKLVIVDFWAEWCGPCKALTPVLEKVCAEYADKGVILAKINVDEEKFIASQFQVQSIPTVYAIFQGQPVADLTPARSESQLKGALDQILQQVPVKPGAGQEAAPDIDQLLAMGEEVLAGGDAQRAGSIFMQITQIAPDNATAHAGLIRAMLAADMTEEAKAAFAELPKSLQDDPALAQAKAALELVGPQVDNDELSALRQAAEANPGDAAAQIAYAEAAFAAGDRDGAAETLLAAIGREPEDGDGAAKAKLLQFFEAVGLEDAWVSAQRRKLSLLLFG